MKVVSFLFQDQTTYENGNLIPARPKFAEESLKQWFRKQTGRLPNPNEIEKLMKVWGDAAHIDFLP